MRVLLAAVVAVAVLLLGDQLLEGQVEQRAATAASEALAAPVAVDLRGAPFAWHLLRGTLPSARLTAEQVPVPGRDATVPSLSIELRQVAVSLSSLRAAELPPAREGTFEARLNAASLAALAQVPQTAGDVEIADGEIRLHLGDATVVVVPSVADGELLLAPAVDGEAGPVSYRARLSDLPGRPRITSVEAVPGELRLRGELHTQ